MKYMRQKNSFRIAEDPFAKNTQSIAFIMHEALLLFKLLQMKLQVQSVNIKYFGHGIIPVEISENK